MNRKPKPIFGMIAAQLNEYAGYIERGERVPNHSPDAPSYWFAGIARECRHLADTSFMDLLTPAAQIEFRKVVATS